MASDWRRLKTWRTPAAVGGIELAAGRSDTEAAAVGDNIGLAEAAYPVVEGDIDPVAEVEVCTQAAVRTAVLERTAEEGQYL